MGWRPSSDEKRAELERALVRAAARMTESDVRNSLWSLATLEWAPMVHGVRESLELALARTFASMEPVEVVDSRWARVAKGRSTVRVRTSSDGTRTVVGPAQARSTAKILSSTIRHKPRLGRFERAGRPGIGSP
jgi:hypothetical protein